MGGVVAGASVLTEACGPRLCGRPVEDLAAGDALVGWGPDEMGYLDNTVEAVRSRDAPPVLLDIRTEHWRIVVAPHQLLQMYVCPADVWHDYLQIDSNLHGAPLSLKTGVPFVEPRLIWAPAYAVSTRGVSPRALQEDGGRTSPGPEALAGPPRYLQQGQ